MILRLVRILISYFLFAIIRMTHNALQHHIWWRLNGVRSELNRLRRLDGNASQTAHVLDIIWRNKLEPIFGPHLNDFILCHNRFTSLEIILQDSVSLYAVDGEKATFVQTEENVIVWKSQYGAFYTEAQYEHAQRVIVVYRESYNVILSLLNSMEKRQKKLIFIHYVPRSGGTLLLQMFECTNRCVTFCEPSIVDFFNANLLSKKSEESDWLVRCAIRMMCKPMQGMPIVDAYVFKIRPYDEQSAFHLTRIFRDDAIVRHLFIYRSVLLTARSHYKLGYGSPFVYMKQKLSEVSPSLCYVLSWYLTSYKQCFLGKWQHIKHPLMFGIRFWLSSVSQFVALRKKNFDIAGILYDDLIADKWSALAEIFHYSSLPVSYVTDAISAFDTDSQENSRWSRAALKHIEAPKFTPKLIAECNNICKILSIPLVDEDCRLEGVITGNQRLITKL